MVNPATEFHDQRRAGDRADRLGILCSGLCATHCLACPLLFSLIPAATKALPVMAAAGLWGTNGSDKILALCSLAFAWFSMEPTFRLASSKISAVLTVAGLTLVLIAAFALPQTCASTLVRHSANCQCVAYCNIPAGMCVSETSDGAAQLIPLNRSADEVAGNRVSAPFRGWVSTCGAVFLMLGHVRNLKFRRSRQGVGREQFMPAVVSSREPPCQGSGMTSTLTSKRC